MYRDKSVEKYIINKARDCDDVSLIRHDICRQINTSSAGKCSDIIGRSIIMTATVRCNECNCFYAQFNKFNNIDKFIATLRKDNIITKEDAFRYALNV